MGNQTAFRSALIIIVLGLAVYVNSLGGKFIWDDDKLVKNNLFIRSWSALPSMFTEDLGAGAGEEYDFYRPIQTLTYRLDYSLWRLREQGYHLTNVLLHIAAALAVYWLINILFHDNILALLTGAFFVSHPAHSEAVAYISGRADSLSLIFILLCFGFYIKYIRDGREPFYFLMCLSYVSALLSKESSLIVPAVLLLYHCTFNKRVNAKSAVSVFAITLAYLVLRATALSSTVPDLSSHPPLLERAPAFFVAMTDYVRILFSPFDLHMEYGNRLFDIHEPRALVGILLVIILIASVYRTRKTDTLVFFSLSWFFITLLPVSGIYPMSAYMAEHWLYLPSIGFFLLLGKGLKDLYENERSRIFAVVIAASLLTFYSYSTIRQNSYWKDPVTFFKTTLKYAPDSYKMHTNLGVVYAAGGMYEEAISSYRKALEIDPGYATAYFNIANSLDALGRREEAIDIYGKTIEMDPGYSKAYNNLGNIYGDMGEIERAMDLYKKAIEIDPEYGDAHYNMGNEYRRAGDNERAIAAYRRALEINPYMASTHNNLAVVYLYVGRRDLAIRHCRRAIDLGFRPHPEFLKELGL